MGTTKHGQQPTTNINLKLTDSGCLILSQAGDLVVLTEMQVKTLRGLLSGNMKDGDTLTLMHNGDTK